MNVSMGGSSTGKSSYSTDTAQLTVKTENPLVLYIKLVTVFILLYEQLRKKWNIIKSK